MYVKVGCIGQMYRGDNNAGIQLIEWYCRKNHRSFEFVTHRESARKSIYKNVLKSKLFTVIENNQTT